MLLLKRMRRDVRKGDLKVFECRLAELELVLGRQPPEQTSLKNQVQGEAKKPGVATDRQRDAEKPKESKTEPIHAANPQQSQPAKKLSEPPMVSWNCPKCGKVISVARSYMERFPVHSGMTDSCGAPIRWEDSKVAPIQESNPQTTGPVKGLPEKRKFPLVKVCPSCRGRVDFDPSLFEPGIVLHHDCGARYRVSLDGQFTWF